LRRDSALQYEGFGGVTRFGGEEQMTRALTAVSALLLGLLSAGGALAQAPPPPGAQPIPGAGAPPTPPVAPTMPELRPEPFGYYLQRGQSVTERPRPELDPLGVHAGSFFIYPRVELDQVYNDNIYASSSGRIDDFITVLSPSVDVKSNWSNHALNAEAGVSAGKYWDNTSEDYLDGFVGTDGRYDITRNLAAFGGLKYEHLHEERDSPDNPGFAAGGAADPVTFDAYSARAGIVSRGLKVGYQADVGFRREDYQDVDRVGGGTLDQDVRDLNTYLANLRVSYEIAPRYEAFARAGYNHRSYDHDDPAGFTRDSNGYRADVGATIDLTGVTFAEVYAGYVIQDYESSTLGKISGVDFGARVVWNATQLTSVSANLDRRVQDSNTFALLADGSSAISPGYLRTNVGLTVDHELLRNVLLTGRVGYENDDYEKIDRSDDRFDIGAGVRYSFTRNFYLGGSYTYTNRSSDGAAGGGGFSRNLFLIRLGAQL
jgi:hypothetical protein